MNPLHRSYSFLLAITSLIIAFASTENAGAASRCEQAFGPGFGSEMGLGQEAMAYDSTRALENAQSKLGRPLVFESKMRTVPSGVSFAHVEIRYGIGGDLVADLDLSYRPVEQKLLVGKIEVYQASARGLGLGEALVVEALRTFPETQQVQTVMLTRTNRDAVEAALARGLSLEQAIKESPAFKIPRKLGFTELIGNSINPLSYDFTVRKPGLP
jgi:hypothetical protein